MRRMIMKIEDYVGPANKANLKYEVKLEVSQVMEPSRLLSRVIERPTGPCYAS